MKAPLLSFCIPTYNRVSVVQECVKNILRCPSEEIEIAVTDNASPDNTFDVLSTITDRRVKIFRNPENIGPGANFVAAVKNATGRFALLLSDEESVYLDQIDAALDFLRRTDPSCGVVRFAMDGVITLKKEEYCAPPGPETFVFAMLNCGDVAGNAYNRRVVTELIPEKYVSYSGFSVMDFLFGVGKEHPFVFCPIVLLRRQFLNDIYDFSIDETSESKVAGYAEVMFSPDTVYAGFCATLNEAAKCYGGSGQADALYGWIVKFFSAYVAFVPSLYIYLHNGGWTDLKYTDSRMLNDFFGKWGPPWSLVGTVLRRCVARVREMTGSALWNSVEEMCSHFLSGHLQMPIAGYTFSEKFIAGDLLAMMGVDSTGHGYFPLTEPSFIFAEFSETAAMYRLFAESKFEEVIAFPKTRTKRDRFFRGVANLKLGNAVEAKRLLLEHVHGFENAQTLNDAIYGQQTIVQAHHLLGRIHEEANDFAAADRHFGERDFLAEKFVLHSYLTRTKLERLEGTSWTK